MARAKIGEPLPRAADAFADERKWTRVFGPVERADVWQSLATAVLPAPVSEVRDLGNLGFTCRVLATLSLGGRTAEVRTSWHYADEESAPRLVTAFPTT
jgi:hypothetical protein